MKKKLYIMIGIIMIMYVAAANIKSTTKITFSIPLIIFSVIIIIYGIKREQILRYIDKIRHKKKLIKIIKICCICLLAGFIMIEGIIICYPKHDTSDSDYILVLGAGLTDGYNPSATLRDRLNAAIDCIDKYGNTGVIVVSGGQGSDEMISEAEAMKKYLIDNGISEGRILVENKSRNTNENFKFSKEIIEDDSNMNIGEVNVKIVTTDFHAFRSRFLAEKNDYIKTTNYSAETIWYLIPIYYVREALALVKSLIFD